MHQMRRKGKPRTRASSPPGGSTAPREGLDQEEAETLGEKPTLHFLKFRVSASCVTGWKKEGTLPSATQLHDKTGDTAVTTPDNLREISEVI